LDKPNWEGQGEIKGSVAQISRGEYCGPPWWGGPHMGGKVVARTYGPERRENQIKRGGGPNPKIVG